MHSFKKIILLSFCAEKVLKFLVNSWQVLVLDHMREFKRIHKHLDSDTALY